MLEMATQTSKADVTIRRLTPGSNITLRAERIYFIFIILYFMNTKNITLVLRIPTSTGSINKVVILQMP